MASAPNPIPRRYTPEEYLALERVAEHRNEYVNGAIVPMAGGTLNHARIGSNSVRLLNTASDDRPFEAYGSDLKIWIPSRRRFFYADAIAIAGAPRYRDGHMDSIENPVLIVEALSPSTAEFDRSEKFRCYREIPELRQYVLISQSAPVVEVFTLRDRFWVYQDYSNMDASVELDSIGVSFPLTAIYKGVNFPPQQPDDS